MHMLIMHMLKLCQISLWMGSQWGGNPLDYRWWPLYFTVWGFLRVLSSMGERSTTCPLWADIPEATMKLLKFHWSYCLTKTSLNTDVQGQLQTCALQEGQGVENSQFPLTSSAGFTVSLIFEDTIHHLSAARNTAYRKGQGLRHWLCPTPVGQRVVAVLHPLGIHANAATSSATQGGTDWSLQTETWGTSAWSTVAALPQQSIIQLVYLKTQ